MYTCVYMHINNAHQYANVAGRKMSLSDCFSPDVFHDNTLLRAKSFMAVQISHRATKESHNAVSLWNNNSDLCDKQSWEKVCHLENTAVKITVRLHTVTP